MALLFCAWLLVTAAAASEVERSAPAQTAAQAEAAGSPSEKRIDAGAPAEPAPRKTRRIALGCEEWIEVAEAEPEPPPLAPAEDKQASIGRTAAEPPGFSPARVIQMILVFVAMLALAYLAGHPTVREFEQRFYISHLATAGLPFVVLGFALAHPAVGFISESVLREIRPLITLGLGWVGFAVGFRFDVRGLGALPRNASSAVLLTTLPPAVLIASGSVVFFWWTAPMWSPNFLRDALVLATAGAMTAMSAGNLLAARGADVISVNRVNTVVQLEQLAGVFGLMLLAAMFRPAGLVVAWQMPGPAWLFMTFGIGAVMSAVIYLVFSRITAGPQFGLALVGSICFAAGMASYLRLSPVAVCFIAGAIVVNFPSEWKQDAAEALARLERPIYYLFLVLAGALWQVTAWQGWLLMLIFVALRFMGKWIGMELFRRQSADALTADEQQTLVLAPIGALSIAIIVNAQDLYFGQTIPWIVTAVIGGAIVTEVVMQISMRRKGVESAAAESAGS